MESIDFSQTGGYRFKQPTLAKMQRAYTEILTAFIKYLNIPDTGNYIISGCEVVDTNITSGVMYIDGELCSFTESPGDANTKIKKDTQLESIAFKNGANLPVLKTVTAVTDVSLGTALNEFTRVPSVPVINPNTVIDANYVATENNFTTTLLNHLLSIENGAEKNVQADWNDVNISSDAFIKNKPNVTAYLRRGVANIGWVYLGSNGYAIVDVNFPDVGTNNYLVVGMLTTSVAAGAYFTVVDAQTNKIRLRIHATNQAFLANFHYYLLPMN